MENFCSVLVPDQIQCEYNEAHPSACSKKNLKSLKRQLWPALPSEAASFRPAGLAAKQTIRLEDQGPLALDLLIVVWMGGSHHH
jgi:hypothetical protein